MEPAKQTAGAIHPTMNLETANPIGATRYRLYFGFICSLAAAVPVAHPQRYVGVIALATESADGVVLSGICRITQIAPQPGPAELKTQSVNYYVLNVCATSWTRPPPALC